MEWGWVLLENQNLIAVIGRTVAPPPLIAIRWASIAKNLNMVNK